MKTYTIIHKLTNKPIRDLQTLEVLKFPTMEEAEKITTLKNKIMQADFYKTVETKDLEQ